MDLTRRDLTASSIYLPLTTFVQVFDRKKVKLLTRVSAPNIYWIFIYWIFIDKTVSAEYLVAILWETAFPSDLWPGTRMKNHLLLTKHLHRTNASQWIPMTKYREWISGGRWLKHPFTSSQNFKTPEIAMGNRFRLLASQSDAHTIAPHRDPIQPNPYPIHPLIAQRQERPMMWYIFSVTRRSRSDSRYSLPESLNDC